MRYQVLYHPEIQSDIAGLPKNMKERIRKAIEQRLGTDPLRYGIPLRRSLHGYRKLRTGDYRIIFKIEQETVVILKIGHRKEVYQKVHLRG